MTLATVTLETRQPGRTRLSITSALVGDRNDTSSAIGGLGNATVRVQPEPAGPVVTDDGNPARDSDRDGLCEDIDGDGTTNILDVARLLDTV